MESIGNAIPSLFSLHGTITYLILAGYSWLQKKTGTIRIKMTHFYNVFIVLWGTRKTGQMCHSVVKLSKPYLSYS
jgi:hypothetical protein